MSSVAAAAKYLFIAKVGFKNGKVYPLEMIMPSVVVGARLWMFSIVLEAAFAAKGVANVNGFTPEMSMWVLMFAQSFQQASKDRVWAEIAREIQSGGFVTHITKPMSYGLFHFWRYLGNVLPSLLTSILIGSGVVLLLVGPVDFSAVGLAAFLPTIFLGVVLNFLLYFCCGLTALWLEDSTPITWIISKAILIFGGMIVPIALLPGIARDIAELLPFSQLFALPSQLALVFDGGTFAKVLLTQTAWLVILSLLSVWLFQKGRRHVASNGG